MAKRLVVALVALSLLVAVVAVAYAAGQVKAAKVLTADVVRAKRIEVVDEKGRVRGGMNGSEAPILWLADGEGNVLASVVAPQGVGPALTLRRKDGKDGLTAWVTPNDTASVLLRGRNGRARAGLMVAPDGAPSLLLSDDDGTVRAVLGSSDLARTSSEAGEKTAEYSLVFLDKSGKVLWRAP